jgi:DNA-binding response OmpR family regulator
MKVLVVEDDALLRDALIDLMKGAGHEVAAVADGLAAVERGAAEPFDLLVLDLMLPKLDGIEVCRRLRLLKPELVILMLTARGSESDKVSGLSSGADDYVTKPFGARELLARVTALGRRAQAKVATPELVEVDDCQLDFTRCIARRDGKSVNLTPREVGILRWLYQHRTQVVSRTDLLTYVWGLRGDTETRTVDVTIAHLRQKIERDPAHPKIVVSVKGAGYAWAVEPNT